MSNARSFFVTFDLTRLETLEHVQQWHREVTAMNPGATGIVVGTNLDRWDKDGDVNEARIDQVGRILGCKVLLVSSKTGEGSQSALLELVRLHMPLVQSLGNSFLHPRSDPVQPIPLWA